MSFRGPVPPPVLATVGSAVAWAVAAVAVPLVAWRGWRPAVRLPASVAARVVVVVVIGAEIAVTVARSGEGRSGEFVGEIGMNFGSSRLYKLNWM